MEALFIYLLKSSGLLFMFFSAYYLFLRKETFFTSNRYFLLLGLGTAVFLPFMVYTQIIVVEPTVSNIDWSKIPLIESKATEVSEINWFLVAAAAYGIGILVFLGKFVFDFYSLSKVLKGKKMHQQADLVYIDTIENIAPFSYLNTIVYNSSLYSASELESILEHEKVHCEQNHTIDVLISRLFCAVFWFNPIVWLYKKAILQNLEFIADYEATKKIADKKAYQFTLLKITTHENCIAITNHFYQSLIKKRIVMLNKNQSNKRNSWKYLLVAPALVAFVLLFQIEVVAQEKTSDFTVERGIDKVVLDVNSSSTEKKLNDEANFFKEEFDLDLNFSGIKLNNDNEIIAIKVVLTNAQGVKKVYLIDEKSPIKPFAVFAEKEKSGAINFGFQANATDNRHLNQHFDNVNNLQGQAKNNANNEPLIQITSSDKPYGFWSINNMKKDGKDYLLVIDGKKQNKNNPIKLPLDLEIDTKEILETEEAVKKYGKDGANGAFVITTKKTTSENIKNLDDKNLESKSNWDLKIDVSEVKERASENSAITFQNDKKVDYKKAVIIIDGKISDYETLEKLNPQDINSVDVRKLSIESESLKQKAIEKYGDRALNGVIEVHTQKNKGWEISYGISKPEDNIKIIQNNNNVDYKKAVIIIDGKVSNKKSLDKLKPEDIATVSVSKPTNGPESLKQSALKKYGEQALNGIIEVQTKK
jgi:hypothetical protein